MLIENEETFIEAMVKDLKTPREARLEVTLITSEAAYIIDHLDSWVKPTYYSKPLAFFTDSHYTVREPLGTVLVIGTWNYPLMMAFAPFIGAICGGNCAVVKPSEVASNTAEAIYQLFPRYMDESCYAVVNGGASHSKELLSHQWDHILYTGGSKVGQIVYEAASKFLTPVTLELGGKSPTIISQHNSNWDTLAYRIIFGKSFNSGQTCIAPDYVFCHESVFDLVVEAMKKAIQKMFGDQPDNHTYGYMINENHHKRVKKLLQDSKAEIIHQGFESESERRFYLTLVKPNNTECPIMKEEVCLFLLNCVIALYIILKS